MNNAVAYLIAGIFVLALSTFMFMFAWNVFVVEVLDFSRAVNIIEALAGSVFLNTISGTVGFMIKKWVDAKT